MTHLVAKGLASSTVDSTGGVPTAASNNLPVQIVNLDENVAGTTSFNDTQFPNVAFLRVNAGAFNKTGSDGMSALVNATSLTPILIGSGTITGGLTTYNANINAGSVDNLGGLTGLTGTRTQEQTQPANDFSGTARTGATVGSVNLVRTNGSVTTDGPVGSIQGRAGPSTAAFTYTVVEADAAIQIVFDTSDGGGNSGGGTSGTINGVTYNGMDGTQNGAPVVVASFNGPSSPNTPRVAVGTTYTVHCTVDSGGSVQTSRASSRQRYNYNLRNNDTQRSVVLTAPTATTIAPNTTGARVATDSLETNLGVVVTGTYQIAAQGQFGAGTRTQGVLLTRSDGNNRADDISTQTVGGSSSVGGWFTSGSGGNRNGSQLGQVDASTSFIRLGYTNQQGTERFEIRDENNQVVSSGDGGTVIVRGPAWREGDTGLGRTAEQIAAAPQVGDGGNCSVAYGPGNSPSQDGTGGRATRTFTQLHNYDASTNRGYSVMTNEASIGEPAVIPANGSVRLATDVEDASGTVGWDQQRPGGTVSNSYTVTNNSGKPIYIGGITVADGETSATLSTSGAANYTFDFTQRENALSGNWDTDDFTGTIVNE